MAAAIHTCEKRKVLELEDITNSNTFHNKKMRTQQHTPQQQRSPSPTDITSSPPPKHHRAKSVTFASGTHGDAATHATGYEESPLLTPKEEEDYDKPVGDSLAASSPFVPRHHPEDLDHNTDYIALSLTLRLLYASRASLGDQIVRLSRMQESYKSASKDDVIAFVLKLVNNELNLPQQARIVRTPNVDWEKYCHGMGTVPDECLRSDDKPMFKTLHLFDK